MRGPAHFLSADPTLGLLVVTATGERPDDLSDAIGHGGGARSDDSPGHHVEP